MVPWHSSVFRVTGQIFKTDLGCHFCQWWPGDVW